MKQKNSRYHWVEGLQGSNDVTRFSLLLLFSHVCVPLFSCSQVPPCIRGKWCQEAPPYVVFMAWERGSTSSSIKSQGSPWLVCLGHMPSRMESSHWSAWFTARPCTCVGAGYHEWHMIVDSWDRWSAGCGFLKQRVLSRKSTFFYSIHSLIIKQRQHLFFPLDWPSLEIRLEVWLFI